MQFFPNSVQVSCDFRRIFDNILYLPLKFFNVRSDFLVWLLRGSTFQTAISLSLLNHFPHFYQCTLSFITLLLLLNRLLEAFQQFHSLGRSLRQVLLHTRKKLTDRTVRSGFNLL